MCFDREGRYDSAWPNDQERPPASGPRDCGSMRFIGVGDLFTRGQSKANRYGCKCFTCKVLLQLGTAGFSEPDWLTQHKSKRSIEGFVCNPFLRAQIIQAPSQRGRWKPSPRSVLLCCQNYRQTQHDRCFLYRTQLCRIPLRAQQCIQSLELYPKG